MSAEGYHAVKYEDGDEYRGQWNGEGKRHGLGVLKFADGTEYAGDFEQGMNHGFGVLSFSDKSTYAGEFKDGKYDGYGVFSKDGMKYEGEFKDGKVDGSGKITFKDKTNGRPRQEGTFQNRMLKTGGKQQAAVNLAKEAEATANEKASKARELRA